MTQEDLNEIRELVREVIRAEIRATMDEMRRRIRDAGEQPLQK